MQYYTWLVIVFSISEIGLFISRRSKKGAVKNQNDKNSLLFLWITIPVCLTLSGFIAGWGIWPFANTSFAITAGLIAAITGFIIRWAAIIQLGRMFTVDVSISETHVLKTGGLYTIVRHPSYLGLMLIIAGFTLCMGNVLSLIVVLIPIFTALNYRMIVEERALENEFGEQYKVYKTKVSRIIPLVY